MENLKIDVRPVDGIQGDVVNADSNLKVSIEPLDTILRLAVSPEEMMGQITRTQKIRGKYVAKKIHCGFMDRLRTFAGRIKWTGELFAATITQQYCNIIFAGAIGSKTIQQIKLSRPRVWEIIAAAIAASGSTAKPPVIIPVKRLAVQYSSRSNSAIKLRSIPCLSVKVSYSAASNHMATSVKRPPKPMAGSYLVKVPFTGTAWLGRAKQLRYRGNRRTKHQSTVTRTNTYRIWIKRKCSNTKYVAQLQTGWTAYMAGQDLGHTDHRAGARYSTAVPVTWSGLLATDSLGQVVHRPAVWVRGITQAQTVHSGTADKPQARRASFRELLATRYTGTQDLSHSVPVAGAYLAPTLYAGAMLYGRTGAMAGTYLFYSRYRATGALAGAKPMAGSYLFNSLHTGSMAARPPRPMAALCRQSAGHMAAQIIRPPAPASVATSAKSGTAVTLRKPPAANVPVRETARSVTGTHLGTQNKRYTQGRGKAKSAGSAWLDSLWWPPLLEDGVLFIRSSYENEQQGTTLLFDTTDTPWTDPVLENGVLTITQARMARGAESLEVK